MMVGPDGKVVGGAMLDWSGRMRLDAMESSFFLQRSRELGSFWFEISEGNAPIARALLFGGDPKIFGWNTLVLC